MQLPRSDILQSETALSLHLAPVLDVYWLWPFCGLAVMLFALSLVSYRRHLALRVLVLLAFLMLLLNPSLLKEERGAIKDTGFIVVDRSFSQTMQKRGARTDAALSYLKKTFEKNPRLDIKVIEAPTKSQTEAYSENETKLFEALDAAAAGIPQKQRAGVIFLSDGQIHDVPKNESLFTQYGPVHALLSGEKAEKDREIIITKAPAYGLVEKEVTLEYIIEDTKNIAAQEAEVTIHMSDGEQIGMLVPTNTKQTLIVKLNHPGENVFTLEAQTVEGELTKANNKAAILINGVRDRLKVLLVSGVPHAGERPWRDLLTSDPGVDLVHFTILRDPNKFDLTPQHELSLIAFPVRELFEEKLYDFDLIIFDRFRHNNILPDYYFENIANYVKRGGAFLEASGPTFAGDESIYSSPVRQILPAKPTGQIFSQGFVPSLTKIGKVHPVTSGLIWEGENISLQDKPTWGRWLRQIEIEKLHGETLLNGVEDSPLLILNRVEKGRVAQISSDHLWLWSRGYDGGGPYGELTRRIVHWLMKEPELDERALEIRTAKNTITIRKQNFDQKEETIAMTTPDGEISMVDLKPLDADGDDDGGWLGAEVTANQLGVYTFEDTRGARKFAIIGTLNPPELHGVKSTTAKLDPLIKASGGTAIWLEDVPEPILRTQSSGKVFGGSNWLALRENKDFTITGSKDIPLLPEWLRLLLLLILLPLLWWREGR